jgi:ABC-type antimicrobial peptide transport system permease subunit
MACALVRRLDVIGIRMALGAESSRILRMVLREALLLVAIGVAIGLPAAGLRLMPSPACCTV